MISNPGKYTKLRNKNLIKLMNLKLIESRNKM